MTLFNATLPVCASLAVILCLRRLASRKHQTLPLPPGPPRLPILGNLLDWPWENEWKVWARWGQLHGDIVYASMGGTNVVILNTFEAANKTLTDKGSIYSDRPQNYFLNEEVGWKDLLVNHDDGTRLRNARRLFLQQLGAKASLGRLESMIQDKIQRFMQNILHDHSPERLIRHVHTLFSSIILDVTYGYKVQDEEDKLVLLIERVMLNSTVYVRPGSVLVDIFPWIKWLPSWMPGTGYRELGRKLKQEFIASRDIPYALTQHQMATGMHESSFVANHIEGQELSAEDEDVLKHAAMIMYGAGAETSISAALSFLLFMTLYPKVQARARAEVDSVVGSARLPNLSDREHLPYLNAVISEVFRFGEIVPIGVPHKLREDDICDGFFMPKGATVVSNIWAISRDPSVHNHPEQFNPDRFMGSKPELDPRTYVFGFGRRICPGRFFAENGLFLFCATVLSTLNIARVSDLDGKEVIPTTEYEGRFARRPKPFPCKIRARSAQAEVLLNPELI